jgi:acetyl-CoA carboxylase biotin carboxyl carrier protein
MNERIDFEQVREAIKIATEADLAELEVESPALRIRVRRTAAMAQAAGVPASGYAGPGYTAAGAGMAMPAAALAPGAERFAADFATDDHLQPVVAPMVGTFYRAPSPDAPPFVKEGDFVEEGQVVCVIEAMKLFNEIQSEKRGRVARVLVENASPVEFGQPLLLIDTAAQS